MSKKIKYFSPFIKLDDRKLVFDNHSYEKLPRNEYRKRLVEILQELIAKCPGQQDWQRLRAELWPRIKYNNDLLNDYIRKDKRVWITK